MKTFRTVLVVLLVGALSAVAAAPAGAKTAPASTNKIVQTCEHDGYQLPGHYSIAALKAAYNSLGTVTQTYSTCASIIQNKIAQESDKTLKHGSGSGSSFPWIVVVIVVIVLIGGGGAFWSYRRSRAFGENDDLTAP